MFSCRGCGHNPGRPVGADCESAHHPYRSDEAFFKEEEIWRADEGCNSCARANYGRHDGSIIDKPNFFRRLARQKLEWQRSTYGFGDAEHILVWTPHCVTSSPTTIITAPWFVVLESGWHQRCRSCCTTSIFSNRAPMIWRSHVSASSIAMDASETDLELLPLPYALLSKDTKDA